MEIAHALTVPPRARIYLHCVVGTGLFLLWDGLSQFAATDLQRFLAYWALAMVSATWKFKVPGTQATFSSTFAFVLMGIADYSLGEALVIACFATLAQCLWRTKADRRGRKAAFNVAAVAIGVTVAYNPAHFELSQDFGTAAVMLPLAALVYFAMNTATVAGMIAFLEGECFRSVWFRLARYAAPYYLLGGLVASLTIVADRFWGWRAGLLVLPLLYLAFRLWRWVEFRIPSAVGLDSR
jgi:hypothetical protein